MAFVLKPQESRAHAAGRLLRQQLDSAAECLTKTAESTLDEEVHDLRTHLKKIRAVLRLIRPALKPDFYHKENRSVRDIARPFREARDATVLTQTFASLKTDEDKTCRTIAAMTLELCLEHGKSLIKQRIIDQKLFEQALEQIHSVRHVLQKQIKKDGVGWKAIKKGFGDTYLAGKNALATAESNPSAENLHELRKQSKYFYYQVEILSALAPRKFNSLKVRIHALTESLGDDHDLVVLSDRVAHEHVLPDSDKQKFQELIGRQREGLIRQSFLVGHRIYLQDRQSLLGQIPRWRRCGQAEKS